MELQDIDFKNYIELNGTQERNLSDLTKNYQMFSSDPKNARPMFLIYAPIKKEFTISQMTHDPYKMLKNGLDKIKMHLDIGDDSIPALRVEFGTGQFAYAYGCEVYEPEDDMPCAKTHVLHDISDVESLVNPPLTAGWFARLEEYIKLYRENAPSFVKMHTPDLQGPFNNAHLIRGNDILFDFYDEPEAVEHLLDKVTEQQIALTKWTRELCRSQKDYFCDWGALWRGGVRISNCSLHMISNDFYNQFIRKYDQRLIDSVGGGRIHYCGTHDDGLFDSFFSMPNMYGVDYDGAFHDLYDLSERAPENVTLLQYTSRTQAERLISGDWPKKRNLIIQVSASSIEEGRDLLARLKKSVPD